MDILPILRKRLYVITNGACAIKVGFPCPHNGRIVCRGDISVCSQGNISKASHDGRTLRKARVLVNNMFLRLYPQQRAVGREECAECIHDKTNARILTTGHRIVDHPREAGRLF